MKWENITKNVAPLFWCFEAFLQKLTKNLYVRTKKWHLRKKLWIPQGEIFLNEFEMGQILKIGFDLMETTFFVQTSEMVQLQKTLAPQN